MVQYFLFYKVRLKNHFLNHSFEICKPVLDGNSGWDFLVDFDDGKGWQKIQVKTAWLSTTNGIEYLVAKNGKVRKRGEFLLYKKGDYDLLAVIHEDKVWLFPFKDIEGRGSLSWKISGDYIKYSPHRINWNEYEVE